MEHTVHTPPTQGRGRLQLGSRFVLFVFLAIAGFYLITEHTAHLFGVLPYLLLLLCPLMHLLHGGHGGHGGHGSQHRQEKGNDQ
jgi:hypothetical protein